MKLNLNDPIEYELIIKNSSYKLFRNNEVTKFSEPITKNGVAKLYTISAQRKLFYVGITKQSFSARLNYGLKAKGKNGYHGYKWKEIKQPFTLTIWTMKNNIKNDTIKEMEIIEAEVAFLWREKSNNWPLYQNEIHFHQSSKLHRDLAEKIYNCIVKSNR